MIAREERPRLGSAEEITTLDGNTRDCAICEQLMILRAGAQLKLQEETAFWYKR
jgi:hypothetical protein